LPCPYAIGYLFNQDNKWRLVRGDNRNLIGQHCAKEHKGKTQELKDSLFITKEFLNAKKLQILQGANQNSPDKSGSDNDLLVREEAVFVFWLKFLKSSQTIFFLTK
jgi:hypothetical protein